MATLQERIKERRTACGMTLLQVANLLGIKEATAQRYESGDIKNIKHETIAQMADIFGCSPAYLMGWTDSLHEVVEKIQPPLTDMEVKLVEAYREQPDMQAAVNKILGIDRDNVVQMPEQHTTKIQRGYAAFGGDGWKTETIEVDPAAVDAAFTKAEARQKEREAQEEESRRNYFLWLEEQEAKQAQEKKSRKRRK